MLIIYLILFSCYMTVLEACPSMLLKEIHDQIPKLDDVNYLGKLTTPEYIRSICKHHQISLYSDGLKTLGIANQTVNQPVNLLIDDLDKLKKSYKGTYCVDIETKLSDVTYFMDHFKQFIAWQMARPCHWRSTAVPGVQRKRRNNKDSLTELA